MRVLSVSYMMPSEVAAKALATDLLEVAREYQLRRVQDRQTVLEILDALAFATAACMRGMPPHDFALETDRFVANMRETVETLGRNVNERSN